MRPTGCSSSVAESTPQAISGEAGFIRKASKRGFCASIPVVAIRYRITLSGMYDKYCLGIMITTQC